MDEKAKKPTNNIKEDPKDKQEQGINLALNLSELKALFNLLKECKIHEFELEKEGFKVKVKQEEEHKVPKESEIVRIAPERSISHAESGVKPGTAMPAPEEVRADLQYITSPMVGTFYRASSQGGDAFIDIGQILKVGQIVCIIESMKIMNEIESDIDGEVVAIYTGNGEPVEFGQKLIAVKKG